MELVLTVVGTSVFLIVDAFMVYTVIYPTTKEVTTLHFYLLHSSIPPAGVVPVYIPESWVLVFTSAFHLWVVPILLISLWKCVDKPCELSWFATSNYHNIKFIRSIFPQANADDEIDVKAHRRNSLPPLVKRDRTIRRHGILLCALYSLHGIMPLYFVLDTDMAHNVLTTGLANLFFDATPSSEIVSL